MGSTMSGIPINSTGIAIGYFVSGIIMMVLIYIDNKRFKKQAESGDDEQVLKMQDIKTWLVLIFLIGIVALPIYAIKTRGKGNKGFLMAFLMVAVYVGIVVGVSLLSSKLLERDPRHLYPF